MHSTTYKGSSLSMSSSQHHRAFVITVFWTLGLLFLGSVVHATGSSLACPDWPTCNGTLVPDMVGGVFWEHLHRLVAGGLILFFLGATYLAWKEQPRFPWVRTAALGGLGLLLVQAVLGGVTVLLKLPHIVSISHLGVAFLFLSLATVLSTVSSLRWARGIGASTPSRRALRTAALTAAALAFAQSMLGAAVRHTGAGMVCPGVPLCLGRLIPPLDNGLVALQFAHRVLGLVLMGTVLWTGHLAFRRGGSRPVRLLGAGVALLVTGQVLLGFLSVYFRLAVVPISLHTLLAASLLASLVALLALTWAPARPEAEARVSRDAGSSANLAQV